MSDDTRKSTSGLPPKSKVKVFKGNFDGKCYLMVAASSAKEAEKAFGVGSANFKKYASTKNVLEKDKDVALSQPGVVFKRDILNGSVASGWVPRV